MHALNEKLFEAIKAQKSEAVKKILTLMKIRKLEVDQDNTELTAMGLSAMESPSIDAMDSIGYSALHYAAKLGNEDIINQLIAEGADVNLQSRKHDATFQGTPIACALNFIEQDEHAYCILTHLIRQKANINTECTTTESQEKLPLLALAARRSKPQCIQLLLQYGASPLAKDAKEYVINFSTLTSSKPCKDLLKEHALFWHLHEYFIRKTTGLVGLTSQPKDQTERLNNFASLLLSLLHCKSDDALYGIIDAHIIKTEEDKDKRFSYNPHFWDTRLHYVDELKKLRHYKDGKIIKQCLMQYHEYITNIDLALQAENRYARESRETTNPEAKIASQLMYRLNELNEQVASIATSFAASLSVMNTTPSIPKAVGTVEESKAATSPQDPVEVAKPDQPSVQSIKKRK